ncbi:MAG TPA: DUF559 domain-containing protein [Gammaproteobacteria bacterium]
MDELTKHAKNLRSNLTIAERNLWFHLRDRRLSGWKFRRQKVIAGYIVDFVCLEAGLIVESDGSQHQEREEYDARRTVQLEREGYKVLRFWNNEILRETKSVLEEILKHLPPHPDPLPKGEGVLR